MMEPWTRNRQNDLCPTHPGNGDCCGRRFALYRGTPGGDSIVATDSSLPALADQIQWWRARNVGNPSVTFVITDGERDGAVVDEEELEAALEAWRDARDARAKEEGE